METYESLKRKITKIELYKQLREIVRDHTLNLSAHEKEVSREIMKELQETVDALIKEIPEG